MNKFKKFLITILMLLTFHVAGSTPLAVWGAYKSDEPDSLKESIRIDHQTPAIGTGNIIGNFHRIEIDATIHKRTGKGELRLDFRNPEMNDFGDRKDHPGELTKGEIVLELLDKQDPAKLERKLYKVLGKAIPKYVEIYLVINKSNTEFYLVIKYEGNTSAIPLSNRNSDIK